MLKTCNLKSFCQLFHLVFLINSIFQKKIKHEKYRYPEQLELLQSWLAKPLESDNRITWVNNLVDQASDIHQVELELLMSLRESIDSLPALVNISIKMFFIIDTRNNRYKLF